MDCAELLWWFFEFIKIFVPISIALAVLKVARDQRRMAEQNLRLSLYKERITAFREVRQLLWNLGPRPESATAQEVNRLKDCVDAAQFLFEDGTVRNFLSEAYSHSSELLNAQLLQESWRGTPDTGERRSKLDELGVSEQKHREWLIEHARDIVSIFQNELDVAKLRW